MGADNLDRARNIARLRRQIANVVETRLYAQFKNSKYTDSGITGLREDCYQEHVGKAELN